MSHRHHFVPQFYLREWYELGCNGFWVYFRDDRGNLIFRRRPAKAIGFIKGLYSLRPDGLTFLKSISNELESGFFAPVDDAASIVHRKLLDFGLDKLSDQDRSIWALFINSLIERNPRRLRELKRKAADIPAEAFAALARRSPSSTLRLEMRAIFDRMESEAVVNNTVLSGLVRYIADEQFIKYVAEMQWLTIQLPPGQDHFLTGDTPVVVNGGGSSTPIYMLSIALSPRQLLVMHKKSEDFDAAFYGKVAVCHSIVVTKQTEKYLVSSRKLADSEHIKYARVADTMLESNDDHRSRKAD